MCTKEKSSAVRRKARVLAGLDLADCVVLR